MYQKFGSKALAGAKKSFSGGKVIKIGHKLYLSKKIPSLWGELLPIPAKRKKPGASESNASTQNKTSKVGWKNFIGVEKIVADKNRYWKKDELVPNRREGRKKKGIGNFVYYC